MKQGWVLGWATPRGWFAPLVEAVFPGAEHCWFDPGPELNGALEAAGPFDSLAGYSLGSHLLLKEAEGVARLAPEVVLLAPIFAFPKEAGRGGKIARAQLSYLQKWVRRDARAALADFSVRAGLDLPDPPELNLNPALLAWGLEQLATSVAPGPAPAGWRLYAGNGDALLDPGLLRLDAPDLQVVEGGSHHPAALLQAWASQRAGDRAPARERQS